MHIGVIGLNHKLAHLPLRESVARICRERFQFHCQELDPHRFLLLSTCNRTEVYFASHCLSDAQSLVLNVLKEHIEGEFDQRLYSFFGQDCFHHLCRVTAGLDSAVLAETEIQGQVKNAYCEAHANGSLPAVMHFAFQKALKVGKTLRASETLPPGFPSLEEAIFTLGRAHLETDHEPAILFVGASHINGKILDHFKKRGLKRLSICNRTEALAKQWSRQYDVDVLDWQERDRASAFDWVIFGTRSLQPLMTRAHVADDKRRLLIDLGVPRNVEPQLCHLKGTTLYNIDQINKTLKGRQRKHHAAIQAAEQHVASHCKRLLQNYAIRLAV